MGFDWVYGCTPSEPNNEECYIRGELDLIGKYFWASPCRFGDRLHATGSESCGFGARRVLRLLAMKNTLEVHTNLA